MYIKNLFGTLYMLLELFKLKNKRKQDIDNK